MRKTRQAIRRNIRNSPNATVWVLGCYADYDKEKILDLLAKLGVSREKSLVAGHHDDILSSANKFMEENFRNSPSISNETPDEEKSCALTARKSEKNSGLSGVPKTIKKRRIKALANWPEVHEIPSISHFEGHQRAFVKVQDGCDAFCTYCIVPFTRERV